jgi:hypothetical protein
MFVCMRIQLNLKFISKVYNSWIIPFCVYGFSFEPKPYFQGLQLIKCFNMNIFRFDT